MPFIGIALHSMNVGDLLEISSGMVWFFLLSPGPIYVHLSWAPRWRLLNQFEKGEVPELEKEYSSKEVVEKSEWDDQLMEVVDEFNESE